MHYNSSNLIFTFLIFSSFVASNLASYGDTSYPFGRCFSRCYSKDCHIAAELFNRRQPWILRLTGWSCRSECSYKCMWVTEKYFAERNVAVKFFGKWAFVRVLGMQEIVSVLASILNLASHLYMLGVMRKKVHSSAPMYLMYNSLGVCAINTWFWSAVFHARDTKFTEAMDYFGALSLVMISFYTYLVRITYGHKSFHKVVAISGILYFMVHCCYMLLVKFDYGLNMKINLALGISNSVGWLLWWLRDRKRIPYLYKSAICISATLAFMSLEVLDFSPIYYLVDAHALWHLGTAPIALLMYRFIIDDCNHLLKQKIDRVY